MKVIVVGAGIGGLTAALFLHRAGIACEVHERASEVRELGVGINLLPHALATLAEIGVADEVEARGIAPERLVYRTRWGQTVWDEPRGRAAGLPPQVSVHRGRLLGVLHRAALERLPEGAICTDSAYESHRETADGVEVAFRSADGTRHVAKADVLVGADGLHSALRRALHPGEGAPRWSGRVMWRGLVPWPAFDGGRSFVIAGGNDARLVLFPLYETAPGEMATNWVLAVRVAEDGASLPLREDWQARSEAAREGALAAVRGIAVPELDVTALVEATESVWEFPMCDREALASWTAGRTTLLGDAAHPMYPFGGNGSAQAMIDGRALACALASAGPEAGLAAYDAARRESVYRLVESNRAGGPERVIDMVEARADGPDSNVDILVPRAEREAVLRSYSQLAGFARDQLAAR